jgi:hypothetical protein
MDNNFENELINYCNNLEEKPEIYLFRNPDFCYD